MLRYLVGVGVAIGAFLAAPTIAQTKEDAPPLFQGQNDRPIIIRSHDVDDDKQQIEIALGFSRDRDGSPAELRLPVLYRLDTGEDWEFRLQSNFLTYQDPNLGFSDISLGFKWNFSDKPRAGWSIVGSVEIPSGSAGFAAAGVEPTLILIHDQTLSDRWGVTLNVGVTYSRDSETLDSYLVTNGAASLSYSLSSSTQLSAAVLVSSPDARFNGITQVYGALGLVQTLSEHTQFSLTAARSFSATGDDYQFVIGLSQRF